MLYASPLPQIVFPSFGGNTFGGEEVTHPDSSRDALPVRGFFLNHTIGC